MEKVNYDFCSDLFDSHVCLPTILGKTNISLLRFFISKFDMPSRRCTAPGPDRIKPEYLKCLPPTLTGLFTRYLSECKVPTSWKTSKTVSLYQKEDPDDISNNGPICLSTKCCYVLRSSI
ncbi:hypothetical protein V3C99_012117 [Haemonchus contortus]|uniref:Reverse transcriptase domain-containing protein n=1 Tax=Haemonchus contortus TaxID=6289 RepID=A0A7I4Y451_HAECO